MSLGREDDIPGESSMTTLTKEEKETRLREAMNAWNVASAFQKKWGVAVLVAIKEGLE